MSSLIFITGGARSGKSNLAVQMAKQTNGKVAFIATAQAKDEEMAQRIMLHKQARPKTWTTFEEPVNVASAIDAACGHEVVIVDCLTLFLSNVICKDNGEYNMNDALDKVEELVKAAKSFEGTVIIISNEVGMGIVPSNELARIFRDLAGKANQIIAAAADEVYVCFSGIPVQIKQRAGGSI